MWPQLCVAARPLADKLAFMPPRIALMNRPHPQALLMAPAVTTDILKALTCFNLKSQGHQVHHRTT